MNPMFHQPIINQEQIYDKINREIILENDSNGQKYLIRDIVLDIKDGMKISFSQIFESLRNFPIQNSMLFYHDNERGVFVHLGTEPLEKDELVDINKLGNCIQIKFRPIDKDQDSGMLGKKIRKKQLLKQEKRVKERQIKQVQEKVAEWRSLHEGQEKLNLDIASQRVGIARKTLDDYHLQLRRATTLGFDFEQHRFEKMGFLRKFVKDRGGNSISFTNQNKSLMKLEKIEEKKEHVDQEQNSEHNNNHNHNIQNYGNQNKKNNEDTNKNNYNYNSASNNNNNNNNQGNQNNNINYNNKQKDQYQNSYQTKLQQQYQQLQNLQNDLGTSDLLEQKAKNNNLINNLRNSLHNSQVPNLTSQNYMNYNASQLGFTNNNQIDDSNYKNNNFSSFDFNKLSNLGNSQHKLTASQIYQKNQQNNQFFNNTYYLKNSLMGGKNLDDYNKNKNNNTNNNFGQNNSNNNHNNFSSNNANNDLKSLIYQNNMQSKQQQENLQNQIKQEPTQSNQMTFLSNNQNLFQSLTQNNGVNLSNSLFNSNYIGQISNPETLKTSQNNPYKHLQGQNMTNPLLQLNLSNLGFSGYTNTQTNKNNNSTTELIQLLQQKKLQGQDSNFVNNLLGGSFIDNHNNLNLLTQKNGQLFNNQLNNIQQQQANILNQLSVTQQNQKESTGKMDVLGSSQVFDNNNNNNNNNFINNGNNASNNSGSNNNNNKNNYNNSNNNNNNENNGNNKQNQGYTYVKKEQSDDQNEQQQQNMNLLKNLQQKSKNDTNNITTNNQNLQKENNTSNQNQDQSQEKSNNQQQDDIQTRIKKLTKKN